MSVIWPARRGRDWSEAAYAVPCPTCNVEIGEPCLSQNGTHKPRAERAEVFGFIVAPPSPLFDRITAKATRNAKTANRQPASEK